MKHKIEVRNYIQGKWYHAELPMYPEVVYQIVETVKRKLRSKVIGNFNPIFCTYRGRSYVVKSDEGDLSDPFRREESYLESLWIDVTTEYDLTPQ